MNKKAAARELLKIAKSITAFFFDRDELANQRAFEKAVLEYYDEQYSSESYEADTQEKYDNMDKWIEFVKKNRQTLVSLLKRINKKNFPLEHDMPTLWIETSDGFVSAQEGNFKDLQSVLDDLFKWLKEKAK